MQNLQAGLRQIKSPMPQNCNRQKPASARMTCCIDMVPPITCRRRNHVTASDKVNLVSTLTCPTALVEVTAERALLSFLDGSCQTPISASAVLDATGHVTLDGMILRPDGSAAHRKQMRAPVDQAERLGAELGAELIGLAGGRDFLV
jgi:porphobilinogen deaminase